MKTDCYKLRYRDNGSVVIVRDDGKESERVSYQGIARLDDVCATSDYWSSVLPALFSITEL